MYEPTSLLTDLYVTSVLMFRAVTAAPGITAFELSFTRPLRAAYAPCARSAGDRHASRAVIQTTRTIPRSTRSIRGCLTWIDVKGRPDGHQARFQNIEKVNYRHLGFPGLDIAALIVGHKLRWLKDLARCARRSG